MLLKQKLRQTSFKSPKNRFEKLPVWCTKIIKPALVAGFAFGPDLPSVLIHSNTINEVRFLIGRLKRNSRTARELFIMDNKAPLPDPEYNQ